jgi:sec-independent protein translocase protein TatA
VPCGCVGSHAYATHGGTELLLILIIVFFIFGVGKVPQLGERIGDAIKGFKKTMHEANDEVVQQKSESSITAGKIAPNTSLSST